MRDGHIHSPFCPHGSRDSFEKYVEKALRSGYRTISFTEHAPLPANFEDPVPGKDSAMSMKDFENYLETVNKVRDLYKTDITIHPGLEVDYIQGYEREIRDFLDEYGPHLSDSILSVHFLKGESFWHCIDYSPEAFRQAVDDFGGIHSLYSAYFRQIRHSASADLGSCKPGRVGHMTLIRKFHHLYPSPEGWESMAEESLPLIKSSTMELDYNGAGMMKEYCTEPYPPSFIALKAHETGIPLVYGSDAHTAKGMNAGKELIRQDLL
ncbi:MULTISPECIES: histidinol-phosphatase HisJ [Salimicrobium]|uniref:Histidinol-phosphatase n=2 Tax=Salimicrobium TaxID=351195 RepID=A0ABY1KM75_9BACI|nr:MULTISPECIES: histidinol-phosphatase HisJ [Salimicrobium]SDX58660.1 histidinol-phosphatase (PHP family) [Salimicrobium album]SIS49296.1 histidinol-phosphate phosphatase [Salimicrobium salexigens]